MPRCTHAVLIVFICRDRRGDSSEIAAQCEERGALCFGVALFFFFVFVAFYDRLNRRRS